MSEFDPIHDVVAAPLGDVIASVGAGVAAAQHSLDEGSLAAVLDLYTESDDERLQLLQAIGYRPTFYALPETTGEVKVSMRLGSGAAGSDGTAVKPAPVTRSNTSVVPARLGLNLLPATLYATPVDAGYANRYGYSANISATLTFTIRPVPAPQGADELRVVPEVVGRTVAEARTALQALGLAARIVDADGASVAAAADDAAVLSQEPGAANVASLGDEVALTVLAPVEPTPDAPTPE
ncbi:PASTA domain-containing protein [Brachybacterium vulturis]|nr:PASTA domain-containing protein [Brachybacterium vulturis]